MMKVIWPVSLRPFEEVCCGVSTRAGGVSPPPLDLNLSYSVGDDEANVHMNRLLFFGFLGIDPARIAIPKQVHGNTVRRADAPGKYSECDALVTNVQGVYLCVSVADCTPVFLFDPEQKAVAVMHAGWRGSAARVSANAVRMLAKEYGSHPKNLLAYIGPCAGTCCYEVGDEVTGRFDKRFVRHAGGSTYLDLKASNHDQLVESGLLSSHIEISPHCTISDPLLFHSFRRDRGHAGRMMGIIGLVP